MDFPYSPVKIDGEFWIIYSTGANGPVLRYQGTTIEDAARQPDGAAAFPVPASIRGGIWSDPSTQTLYAPLHVEVASYAGHPRCEIHLASSTDKGLTWKYLGPILTSPTDTAPRHPVTDQSGPYWDAGDGDPVLYVDQAPRYAYLFTTHAYWPKIGANVAPILEHRVARCSLDDELAPGKWRKWSDGAWSEPGLGGEGTPVNAAFVSYNTFLKKYLACNGASSLAVCDDLAKQDWSPAYSVGPFWGATGQRSIWITDQLKSDLYNSGQDFFVYNFWRQTTGRRFNCAFDTGAIPAAAGFTPTLVAPGFSAIQATTANAYGYQPLLEADDSIWARRTRRVGCASAEMKYKGNWTDAHADEFYEGRAKSASDPGAEVSFTFHGRDIYWRAVEGPDAGKAEVYLDDKLQATVDCWASRENPLAILFLKRDLADRDHTIRIVATGAMNPLSTGATIRHLLFEYAAETYRASDDFSGVAGKNHWTALEHAGSTDNPLTFSEPFWSNSDGCQVGFTRMTAGTGDAARQWLAPHEGTVRIEGTPTLRGAFSDELDATILRNDATAWTAALTAAKPSAPCDIAVPVKKGDALYFIVHCSAPPSDSGPGLEVLGNRQALQPDPHGLSFASTGRILVHLPKPALSFTGSGGVEAKADPAVTTASFEVKVDARTISRLAAPRAGQPFSIDLNGATDFEIDAGPGLVLGNATVTALDGTNIPLATLPVQDPHDGPPSADWDPVITYVK
jgi:hypothetical protein